MPLVVLGLVSAGKIPTGEHSRVPWWKQAGRRDPVNAALPPL